MKKNSNQSIYEKMKTFAEMTNKFLVEGKVRQAKNCILKAEDLFIKGTAEIKNAVTNVYLFSISSFMEINSISVKPLLPLNLEKEYNLQKNASGK